MKIRIYFRICGYATRLKVDKIASYLYRHLYISVIYDIVYGESRIKYSSSLHHLPTFAIPLSKVPLGAHQRL